MTILTMRLPSSISIIIEGVLGKKCEHWLVCMQALQQLFCARRILGNSYVSAFYFFGNDMFSDEISPEQNDINQSLFEDQQACLETEVIPRMCMPC